jgi:putative glutamine amidotransferase
VIPSTKRVWIGNTIGNENLPVFERKREDFFAVFGEWTSVSANRIKGKNEKDSQDSPPLAEETWHSGKEGVCQFEKGFFRQISKKEMKKTRDTVILISAGKIPGKRSVQTAQSELYARAFQPFGASCVLDGGCGDVSVLAERMDGLLLSGGGDIHPRFYGRNLNGQFASVDEQRDERERDLLRSFCEKRKPVFGICRGIQVVDVFFGGTLFRELGTAHLHESTIHSVVTSENGGLREMLGERLSVNSYHHQAIRTLGRGLVVTAVSDADGVIEGIEHDSLPVSAVQWHAERMIEGVCRDTETSMRPLLARFVAQVRQSCVTA